MSDLSCGFLMSGSINVPSLCYRICGTPPSSILYSGFYIVLLDLLSKVTPFKFSSEYIPTNEFTMLPLLILWSKGSSSNLLFLCLLILFPISSNYYHTMFYIIRIIPQIAIWQCLLLKWLVWPRGASEIAFDFKCWYRWYFSSFACNWDY